MDTKRIGKIVYSLDTEEIAHALAKMKFVPFRAEYLYERQVVEATGYSPWFDQVETGEKIPHYEIIIQRRETKPKPLIFVNRLDW